MSSNGEGRSAPGDGGEAILAALIQPERPRALPVSYVASLALAALIAVLLPLIYVALVVGIAWGWWWYMKRESPAADEGFGFLQAAPFFVGPVLVFFMLKPFLARRPPRAERHTLDPDEHPLLFAFVERCCAVLGARVPARIDVNLEVNASASLARGLPSLFTGEMALTLGLPVVAALELRELTAVLAHELGHVSQAAGMRCYYLTRTVIAWLARVAYERDRWDLRLQAWSQRGHLGMMAMLAIARGCVWLTRALLKGLLRVGAAATSLLSRQMEFDADRNAVRLCGSDAFARSLLKLPEIVVASQWAASLQEGAYREGRLAEDLPELVRIGFTRLPSELREHLRAGEQAARVDMYADHPPSGERVGRARELGASGTFAFEAPSTVLFADFASVCREASRRYYEQVLGRRAGKVHLVPSAEIGAEADVAGRAGELLHSFYVGVRAGPVTLALGSPPAEPPADVPAAFAELKRCRRVLWEGRHRIHALAQKRDHLQGELARTRAVLGIREARNPPRTGSKEIDALPAARAKSELARLEAEHEALRGEEKEMNEAVRGRVFHALALGRSPSVRARFEAAPQTVVRVEKAWRGLDGLVPASEILHELFDHGQTLLVQFQLCGRTRDDENVQAFLGRRGYKLGERLREAWERLVRMPYPLDAAEGVTLGKYLIGPSPNDPSDIGATLGAVEGARRGWGSLVGRLMAEMGEGALALETALNLKPFPVFVPEAAAPEEIAQRAPAERAERDPEA